MNPRGHKHNKPTTGKGKHASALLLPFSSHGGNQICGSNGPGRSHHQTVELWRRSGAGGPAASPTPCAAFSSASPAGTQPHTDRTDDSPPVRHTPLLHVRTHVHLVRRVAAPSTPGKKTRGKNLRAGGENQGKTIVLVSCPRVHQSGCGARAVLDHVSPSRQHPAAALLSVTSARLDGNATHNQSLIITRGAHCPVWLLACLYQLYFFYFSPIINQLKIILAMIF